MKLVKAIVAIMALIIAFIAPEIQLAFASDSPTEFEFVVNQKSIRFNSFDICKDKNLLKKWNRAKGGEEIKKVSDKILKMGFSHTVCTQFLFPGMEQVFDALEKKVNLSAKNATINFESGKPVLQSEVFGSKFLREETAKKLIENLCSGTTKIEVATEKIMPEYTISDISDCANVKSRFSTWCGNSSNERKNNICVAIRAINNTEILPGETFSFNGATGVRNESKGYKKAKIISNGKYIEGTGGGVCQVSTTLYNAALLAGLKIVEAHQHSLAVSYVEPSRDAMVNGSSADLKFVNNTNKPVYINAQFLNDQDIVIKIYGQKNSSNFEIKSKVLKVIESTEDEISSNSNLAPVELKSGETYRVSVPKAGIESEAFLVEKDCTGKVVRQTKLRHNKYNPTKGVVIVG